MRHTKSSNFFLEQKKNKKSIQKIDTLFYPHETEKSFDWLVATELHLSLSLLRLLLLLLHREEARSGVE